MNPSRAFVLGALLLLHGAVGAWAAAPEIAISGRGVEIASGDTTPSATDDTDFGTVPASGGTVAHTFTITNAGDAELNLLGWQVLIYGLNAADFKVTAAPATPVTAGGGTTSLTVTFDPSGGGLRAASLLVWNDDSDETFNTFDICGRGSVQTGIAVALSREPNTLLHFDPAGVSKVIETQAVSGLAAGEQVVALARRPATGALLAFAVAADSYDVQRQGTLYTIDLATGAATMLGAQGGVAYVNAIGNPVALPAIPNAFGPSDYNMTVDPVADQVRLIAGVLNFRIDPVSGLPLDGDLGLATGRPAGVNPDHAILGLRGAGVGAAAYTNAAAGATATTLYAIEQDDSGNFQNPFYPSLYLVRPPASGMAWSVGYFPGSGYVISDEFRGLAFPSSVAVTTSNAPVSAGYGYVAVAYRGSGLRAARLNLATREVTATLDLPDYLSGLTLLSTPAEPATITSPTVANVTYDGAKLGGNVTNDGRAPILECGVVVAKTSLNTNPVINGLSSFKYATAGVAGVFTVSITGLQERTGYTYRAYVTTGAGTSYTGAGAFTTPPEIDFTETSDAADMARGPMRIYPLANDYTPNAIPVHLVSVSDPAIIIDGRSLIIPAGYTGSFTYKTSNGTQTGQGTVSINGVASAVGTQFSSGLLRDAAGAIAGSADVAFTRSGTSATVVLKAGASVVRALALRPAGATAATAATALGALTITPNQDGTVTAQLAAPVPLAGLLTARHAPGPRALYRMSVASTRFPKWQNDDYNLPMIDPGQPGGGFALATVLPGGTVTLTTVLPDGSVFSAGTSLRENNTIAFYSAVRGAVSPPALTGGELVLADLRATDLTGESIWVKPPQTARVHTPYYGGIDTILSASGSRYAGETPFSGRAYLYVHSGRQTAGNILDEVTDLTVRAGQFSAPSSSLRNWTVYPKDGTFRATVTGFGRPIPARGIYLPKSKTFWGFFASPDLGGSIALQSL